jgi:ribokinase
MDTIAAVDHLPAAGETISATGIRQVAGGKGLNQAIMAAHLDATVTMIGQVGDDQAGRSLIHTLGTAEVNTDHVASTGDAPTGSAFICVADDGENHIVLDPGANASLRADLPAAHCDVLIAQLETPMEVVDQMIDAASGFVCLNAAPATALRPRTIERCDLIVVNEGEWSDMPELRRAARVVVTQGAAGCTLHEFGSEVLHVPAPEVQAVDTVGAGDAFVAVVTLAVCAGADLRLALQLGCRAGALTTTRVGASTALPDKTELFEAA